MSHETGGTYTNRDAVIADYTSGHLKYDEALDFLYKVLKGAGMYVRSARNDVYRVASDMLGGPPDPQWGPGGPEIPSAAEAMAAADAAADVPWTGAADPRVAEPYQTPIVEAPLDREEILADPNVYSLLFNRRMGIPTAGRSFYEDWLSGQSIVPRTEFALRDMPNLGILGTEAGDPRFPDQTFEQYMETRGAEPMSYVNRKYFDALTTLSPEEQQLTLDLLPPDQRNEIEMALMRGALRSQGAGRYYAKRLTDQAFKGRGQFAISDAGIGGGSWLNYLKTKYPLDPEGPSGSWDF
jgi:hypothetical protein